MKKDINSSDIVKLLSIIPQDRGLFFRGILQYGLWAIYPIFGVIMLGEITSILETGSIVEYQNTMIIYAIGILLLHIAMFCSKNIGRTEILAGYTKVLHRTYMKEYVYLDTNAVERIGTGRIISIIEKGLYSRSGFISYGLEQSISLIFTLLYFVYLFSQMGVFYLFGFFIILIIAGISSFFLNKKVLSARRKRITADNQYSKELVRIIMSKTEIMQSWNQEKEMSRLDKPQDIAIQANKNMNPYIHRMFFAPQILLDLSRLFVFLFLGFGYFRGDFSLTLLVTLGSGFVLLDSIMSNFIQFYKNTTKEFDIVKRMRELFENNKPSIAYDSGNDFIFSTGDIIIKHIDFSYGKEDKKILFSDFSLSISGGQSTALVGVSGSGKSTLIKLIAGYLRPDSGKIIVDNQELDSVSKKSYYKHIGYLTQEPSVFDGTILENLTYAIEGEVSEEKLKECISLAECNFIRDLEDGLKTEIGERGIRLSGGQRQRLAIAKIFLKNPEIIILDEPTSALDSFSEESVTKAMNNLFNNRTIIIIAHRLQTVKNADDIIVLDQGSIVERGTHDSLVQKNGFYAKMLELQSGF